jgi:hypothetical protein
LLSKQRAEIRNILSGSVYSNPFKKSGGKNDSVSAVGEASTSTEAGEDGSAGKGLALIDVWKKPVEKPSLEFNPKGNAGGGSKRGRKSGQADKDKEVKEKPVKGKGKATAEPENKTGKVFI